MLVAVYAPILAALAEHVRRETFISILSGVFENVQKELSVADGCVIEGTVINSILFRGVKVAKGAVVKDSIVFQESEIAQNSRLNCVIADKQVRILENRELSGLLFGDGLFPDGFYAGFRLFLRFLCRGFCRRLGFGFRRGFGDNVPLAWRNQYCGLFKYDYKGTVYYFIDNEYYFKRPALYGYYDDGERFAFLSRAVAVE